MNVTNVIGYLSKFDNAGRIKGSEPVGASMTESEQTKYEADGYIQISVDDWNTYMGNNGWGNNGTGYIRDPKTGKPVSAPPAPPVETTEVPTANVPETELAVMEGMVDMQSRIAALEAELAKLKGGK